MLRRFAVLGITITLAMQTWAVAEEWGNLSGTFVLDGAPAAAGAVSVTKDVEVCGKEKLVDETITVNPTNKGIANVVIYLVPERGKDAPKAHASYDDSADAKVQLDNKSCRFEPHVALLRTSQTLVIGNKDPVGHNTKIDTLKNAPINPIVPAGSEIEKKFDKAEGRPLPVSCNIHPWMKGWVLINDHPYMAVTDADGKFKIENLPTGEWTFQIFHNKYVQEAKVGGKATKWKKGKAQFTIKAGENDIGTVAVAPSELK